MRRLLPFAAVFTLVFASAHFFLSKDQVPSHRNRTEPLSILLATNGRSPYEETAPADVLATVNGAVLGQLIRATDSFELEPALLKSWNYDFSSSTYELTLSDSIVFHNGRNANSADLEYSLLRGFFSKHRNFYAIYLGNIQGIDDVNEGAPFRSGIVSGVKIIDAQRLSVKLRAPNPSFPFSLVNPYFSLVPREEIESDNSTWKHKPIGAGPYKTLTPFSNGKLALELVNPDLTPRAPRRVDLYTTPSPDKEFGISIAGTSNATAFIEVNSKYPVSVWSIFFSNANQLGADENFRKAVASAINRSQIADLNSTSSPAYELLPKHFWGRKNIQDSFDLSKAKALLKKVPENLLKKPLRVPVFSAGPFSEQRKRRLEMLAAQLGEIGVIISFFPSSEKFLTKETAEECPMKISGRVTDVIDPLIMFASFKAKSPYTYEKPSFDARLEELFQSAAVASGSENRTQAMQNLSAYLSERAYIVPILEDRTEIFVNPKLIEDLGKQNQPMTLFLDRLEVKSL